MIQSAFFRVEKYNMKMKSGKVWLWVEKKVTDILNIAFKIFGKNLTKNKVNFFLQFMKFGIVGISNTVIYYLLYVSNILLFRKVGVLKNSDYLAAQIIAFGISVLWSFYWNNKLVFVLEQGKERSLWRALLKTYISYSFTGLFLNSLLLVLWVHIFHISEYVAPVINLLISVPINFIINKFWAFNSSKS